MPRDRRHLAEVLLRKAAADAEVVRMLLDADAPYEVIGFHAQQSSEKAIKAVLAAAGVDYPHTHSIALLADLAHGSAIEVPDLLERVTVLTPFAVLYRYDDFDVDEEPVAGDVLIDLIDAVLAWASRSTQSVGPVSPSSSEGSGEQPAGEVEAR